LEELCGERNKKWDEKRDKPRTILRAAQRKMFGISRVRYIGDL